MPRKASGDGEKREKRGHGEGSAHQRKDGLWQSDIRLPDGTRPSVYGKTKSAATKKARELLARYNAGEPPKPKKLTVAQYLTEWVASPSVTKLEPGTVQGYEEIVRLYLVPRLGRYQLHTLNAAHVENLLATMQKEGKSAARARAVRTVLRIALNRAIRARLITYNAAEAATAPTVRRRIPPTITADLARAIIDAMPEGWLRAMVITALTTGMRRGEVVGLRWSDIDEAAGLIHIRQQVQVRAKTRVISQPKSKRTRTVPLVPLLRDELAAWRTVRPEAPAYPEYVFVSYKRRPFDPAHVTKRFREVCQEAGLPDLHFHDLRHGVASLLLALGVPHRIVMELLGHADISITMNTYTHVDPALLKEATDRLDDLLKKGKGGTKAVSEDEAAD